MGHGESVEKIYLPDYFIALTEVTNAQFEEFVFAGGYNEKKYWSEKGWTFIKENEITVPKGFSRHSFNDPNKPVAGVSWYEADAFCRWAGKRLPTEAEWEKAAKGTDGRIYPWGNHMDFTRLVYQSSNVCRSMPVGLFPTGASPYGLLDIAGNVWEWTADTYGGVDYKYTVLDPKETGKSFDLMIVKGGSWGSNRRHFRCSYQYYERKSATQLNIGFRCVDDASSRVQ